MTRKIKFRAWHIEEKKICQIKTLTSEGCFLVGVKAAEDQITKRMTIYAPIDGRFCKMTEIELMQFTGLLSCEGKEIYEGDLVVLESDKDYEYPRQMIWMRGGFWCNQVNGEGKFPITFLEEKQPTQYKIIGNIYENSHLLSISNHGN